MKRATIYNRKKRLYFHSDARTTAGVLIGIAPFLAIEESAPPSSIAAHLKAVLEASTEGVAHPVVWGNLFEPVLKLASVKSWGAFAKSASCCLLELDGEELRVIPTRNLGPRNGYEEIREKAVVISFQEADERLAEAVAKAFDACEQGDRV